MIRAYFAKRHPDAILPVFKTEGSVACDICALEDTVLHFGKTTKVRTGLVAVAPIGFYWELCVRSSLGLKYPGVMLSNSIGIIDSDFSGPEDEICVLLYNAAKVHHTLTGDLEPVYVIQKGERIAQLVLREAVRPLIVEINHDTLAHRSSRGGFGSTDIDITVDEKAT
jgi:deoxyuridine 5'-triphosphate nucleotidohydrolase